MSRTKNSKQRFSQNVVDAQSQREHLMHHFQMVNNTIGSSELLFKGCIKSDGRRCKAKNWSQRINELRNQGVMIEGLRVDHNYLYVYHGLFENFGKASQEEFMKAGWVYPAYRKHKRRK